MMFNMTIITKFAEPNTLAVGTTLLIEGSADVRIVFKCACGEKEFADPLWLKKLKKPARCSGCYEAGCEAKAVARENR
jgi:hypothetical protein